MLIPFPELLQRHSFTPKGILHIGASVGQESDWYAAAGVENVIWIEAIPEVFKKLKENISCYLNNIAFNNCISEKDYQTVSFNISSNGGESSSVFEFQDHSKFHPDVTFVDKINLTTIRVDTLLNAKKIDIRDYDYLSCDLQGSELAALRSMGDMLRLFKYVYIEVNKLPLYRGIPLVGEIDKYLADFGFEPVDEKYTGAGWGDKFYIKKQNMNSVFRRNARQFRRQVQVGLNVPDTLMPYIKFPYPPDNHEIFERWYYENVTEKTDRVYIPIQWTAYLVNNNFGNDTQSIKELQSFVDQIDRSKKYYTIHQFDLGCMVDFKDLDILVFGMAGGRIDYCLPLLCQPHKYEFDNPKTLFASFIGRHTHPLREVMFNNIRNKQGCYVSDAKHEMASYCSILSSSIFSLCPRGFGNASFRIQESLQYGAIPVIISNERIEPHGVSFENYGVYIDEKDVGNVYEILQTLSVNEVTEKQSKLQYYFDNFFTYTSNMKLISDQIKK